MLIAIAVTAVAVMPVAVIIVIVLLSAIPSILAFLTRLVLLLYLKSIVSTFLFNKTISILLHNL